MVIAGMGAHSYSKGSATGGSKKQQNIKKSSLKNLISFSLLNF